MIESNSTIMESESFKSSEKSSYSSIEEKFTATVINGTGQGEFVEGQEVTIVTNNPEKEKVFEG